MRVLIRLSWVALLVTVASCSGTRTDMVVGEAVTIYRDAHHTPHIFADSNRGVFYGYGYAVAVDRLFQMEMLRRTTQGRVAEVLGADFLALDTQLRTSYDHRAVRRQLQALPEQEREILAAYAEGFNARLDEVLARRSELLPAEFTHYDFLPEPWSAYDVAMLFVGSIAHRYSDFNSERDNLALLRALEQRHGKEQAWRIFNASKWLLDTDSPTTVPRAGAAEPIPELARPDYLDALAAAGPLARVAYRDDGRFAGLTDDPALAEVQRARLAERGFAYHPEYTGASNYWAVRDLADARAALLNGPQFGFSVPGYVYGVGLHGGDFDATGNTLLALPCLLFAHNNAIAWGSTAGISDQSDEFVLELDPDNPLRYRYDGGWRLLETWSETIAVRDAGPVTVTARRSAQGMVLHYDPAAGVAVARARTWEGYELSSLMAWTFLATDTSLDAAHARIGAMGTNINIYTMDRQGNLDYVHAGKYPRRAQGHDPRLPVPGDGSLDWSGRRPYSDNPTVRNPDQGYIANWNNRPSSDWISSDLWTYTWGRADRSRILFDLIEGMPARTVAAVSDINRITSYADVNAPFLLPYLFSAWESADAGALEREALAILREWGGLWQLDQAGSYGPPEALMEAWLRLLLADALGDDIGEAYFHLYAATNYPNAPLGPSIPNPPGAKALVRNLDALAAGRTPDFDFFNGEDPGLSIRRSFSNAVRQLAAVQGPRVQAWRLAPSPMEWRPYNFRGVPQALASATQRLPAYMNRGSENNLFVATGDGIVARDVVPPGQSGFVSPAGIADPHASDQLPIYADFAYKTVPFTREAVAAVAVSEKTLQISP
jgi:penicillin amidase